VNRAELVSLLQRILAEKDRAHQEEMKKIEIDRRITELQENIQTPI